MLHAYVVLLLIMMEHCIVKNRKLIFKILFLYSFGGIETRLLDFKISLEKFYLHLESWERDQ